MRGDEAAKLRPFMILAERMGALLTQMASGRTHAISVRYYGPTLAAQAFKAGLVEWLTAMTYQAASGAGAQNMRELVAQMVRESDNTTAELLVKEMGRVAGGAGGAAGSSATLIPKSVASPASEEAEVAICWAVADT